ncbi:MAG: HAD-IIA family hydrolase [Magnetococcales bacterium]|nr:HAD-IIA family hydrolase [Magnetococcales bacterium]
MNFSSIRLVAFDLDGTLWLGDALLPGALQSVQSLSARYRIAYHTNNSTRSDAEVADKLRRLGVVADPEAVHTSTTATARHLVEEGLSGICVIGSSGLRRTLENHGLRLVDDASASHVVVGMDVEIDYHRITMALQVLLKGGLFIACNADANFPVEGGHRLPGCGAMVGAIQGAVGRGPDRLIGKPSPCILAQIAAQHGLRPEEILVVGDSLESDIAMARAFGSPAVLFGAVAGDASEAGVVRVADHAGLLAWIEGEIGVGWR